MDRNGPVLSREVYAEPAFGEVMRETVAWFGEHLPPA